MAARLIIILLIVAGLFLMGRKALANERAQLNGSIDSIFKLYGQKNDLDWKLLKAIATIESSLNASAVNPADPSYGLMQILCLPDGKGGCKNRFPAVNNWPPTSKAQLLDPEYNISVGAQILKWNIDTYGMRKGVAVYNSWAARYEKEPFKNQRYVDKVFAEYRRLRDDEINRHAN